MRCPDCGGHLTISPGAICVDRRSYLNNTLVDRYEIPTTIAACDRCEYVRDLAQIAAYPTRRQETAR